MLHLIIASITGLPACFTPSPTCFTASFKIPPSLLQAFDVTGPVIHLKHISKGWRAFGNPGVFLMSPSPLPLEVVHGISHECNRVWLIRRRLASEILAKVLTILLTLPSSLKTVFFKQPRLSFPSFP